MVRKKLSKKLYTAVGILAVIAILLGIAYYFKFSKHRTQPFKVSTKTLDSSMVPSGFPENMPIEAGSSVLQNYESYTTDGRKQSTRVASTSKNLDEAVKTYSDFFVHLGWTLIPIPDSGVGVNSVSALLKNDDNTLLISARTDEATKKNSISLTLTELITGNSNSNIKK